MDGEASCEHVAVRITWSCSQLHCYQMARSRSFCQCFQSGSASAKIRLRFSREKKARVDESWHDGDHFLGDDPLFETKATVMIIPLGEVRR